VDPAFSISVRIASASGCVGPPPTTNSPLVNGKKGPYYWPRNPLRKQVQSFFVGCFRFHLTMCSPSPHHGNTVPFPTSPDLFPIRGRGAEETSTGPLPLPPYALPSPPTSLFLHSPCSPPQRIGSRPRCSLFLVGTSLYISFSPDFGAWNAQCLILQCYITNLLCSTVALQRLIPLVMIGLSFPQLGSYISAVLLPFS